MNTAPSRASGVLLLLIGLAGVLWAALGDPQGWHGGMRWARSAVVLASLGLVTGSARLLFPGPRREAGAEE
ncbi:hypothetical protein [Streptomyces sp. NBC_00525]|uniref:hypothetical protein n=1 Tax=Streptomyces sp. NBC_00525 TaxID=2903660 RepID=UPI002E807534|nr:hypothetical protein [Streptomyces sp. NBC_00525]WUC94236.1 hypothetical protein OG710_11775 [Streptomyces sp. NBC_00525]